MIKSGFFIMERNLNQIDTFQRLLKKFLIEAYLLTDKFGSFDVELFSERLNRTHEEIKALLSILKGLNMINTIPEVENHYKISSGGINNIKLVLTGGVFDILHLGHLKTLEEAKKLGDILIVVVASDTTVKKRKGRLPINNQENRIKLLSYLNFVDIVVGGDPDPNKFINIVKNYHPNSIVLGYDQSLTEEKLSELLDENKLSDIEIIRLGSQIPNEKSSLKVKNLDKHSFE